MMASQKKWMIFIFIDFIIVLIFIIYLMMVSQHNKIKINGIYIKNPLEISDFQLMDHQGNALTKKDLQGNWILIFFGFTHCPMICPTTLAMLNKTYLLLEKELPASKLPKVIFITIDPENDSKDKLANYVNSFNSHFIGAKGDKGQTLSLEKDLHVTTIKINNTLNHTSDVILLNPNTKIQAYFPFPSQSDKLAKDYITILKHYNILK